MRFTTLVAALAAISTVTATPTKRWYPNDNCLSDGDAETIVAKFVSILEGVDYEGQSPNITAKQVVARNYVEYSDSILSLEGDPLTDTPSATSRAQWLSEVLQHPDPNIQTLNVIHSCNQIVWHWLFPQVGSGQYRVKGFNLLTINAKGKIERADIEFNSIAWGLDTQQLYQYCPPPSS